MQLKFSQLVKKVRVDIFLNLTFRPKHVKLSISQFQRELLPIRQVQNIFNFLIFDQ